MKKLPILKNDKEAEEFLDTADLSEYDLSVMKKTRFEFEPKAKTITMRLPESLLRSVKKEAKKIGIPYQRFIRQLIESSLAHQ